MRLVFFGNNRLGLRIARLLKAGGDEVVAAVLHPRAKARRADEIAAVFGPETLVLEAGDRVRQPEIQRQLAALSPEIGVAAGFGYLFDRAAIDVFPRGIVNLHTGFLPFNRGSCPNIWAIVDGTPAGAALHYVDEGVDTGPIIDRREVAVGITDTAREVFDKQEDAAVALFERAWPLVRAGKDKPFRPDEAGTCHRVADLARLDELDLEKRYRLADLLAVLRARTFPPHESAYFRHRGRKVFVRVELKEEGAGDGQPA